MYNNVVVVVVIVLSISSKPTSQQQNAVWYTQHGHRYERASCKANTKRQACTKWWWQQWRKWNSGQKLVQALSEHSAGQTIYGWRKGYYIYSKNLNLLLLLVVVMVPHFRSTHMVWSWCHIVSLCATPTLCLGYVCKRSQTYVGQYHGCCKETKQTNYTRYSCQYCNNR